MLQFQDAITSQHLSSGPPMSRRRWRVLSLWMLSLVIMLLGACGGGGGSDTSSPGSVQSPVMPTAIVATSGDHTVTITWAAVPGATSYNIYRSTSQGSIGTKVGASSTTSYVDSTASNDTTYFYEVSADNAAGEGPASAQSTGVKPSAAGTVPAAPTGVSVVSGNAQVSVTWVAISGVASYNVYRSTSQGSKGTKVGSSSTAAYIDTTAINGATYYYSITAVNAVGEGAASAQSSGVVPAVPVAAPAAPTGFSATGGDARVTLTWTAISGASYYNIYRSASQGSQGSKIASSSTASYTDATAANGTTYYYAITAVNAAGEGSRSVQSSGIAPVASLTVPAAPTGVNATAVNAQVSVSWTAASGATSYNVYRSTTQGSRGAKIGSSTTQQYTDSTVANGVTYFYVVTAVGAVGEGLASTQSAGAVSITFMGSNTVLIGGTFNDTTAASAPFDVRYAYVHSKPAASPTYYTDTRCSDAAAASGWWGCWSGNTTAPGFYVTWWNEHVTQATWQGSPRPQIFFWTWYSLRDLGDMAGQGDGPGEVVAINRLDLLTLYMNDYRFFLQKIGNTRAMVDIEPDFWGYVKSLGNPHQVLAKVSTANPTDCGSQENSAAGLARCLISMARKYAPNTTVGMHLSCWDWQNNTQGCRDFYLDIGATNADFLVADVSDRDAGWYALPAHGGYDNFWTDQKAAAVLGFYKTMAETVGKPMVLWQIPVGNMAQNNTLNHYQDDKVDWFFSHMSQVADAHIAGLLFGAGHGEQTSAETDGGNLINKTISYRNSGGTPIK